MVAEARTLAKHLRLDEGEKLKPYRCTAGYLTIGVGRNLDAKGITPDESKILLATDITEVYEDMRSFWPWMLDDDVPANVRLAFANMLFNMGATKLRKFKNMIAALEAGDYIRAASEAKDSKWYTQVGERGPRVLADMTGKGRDD